MVDARDGRTLTRAEHDSLAEALAEALHAEYDVRAGTRVALGLAPSIDALTLLFALAKLGAAPVLLPASLAVPDARAVAAIADCRLLVVHASPYRDGPAGPLTVLDAGALPDLATRHADAAPAPAERGAGAGGRRSRSRAAGTGSASSTGSGHPSTWHGSLPSSGTCSPAWTCPAVACTC